MICNKCKQKLPDDSEFCQYCGTKLEKIDVVPADVKVKEDNPTMMPKTAAIVSDVEDVDSACDTMSDVATNAFVSMCANEVLKAMEMNRHILPINENDGNFGLVPENPIYTHALESVDGEEAYLNKLRMPSGERIKYLRRGSVHVEGVNGMVDIYEVYSISGQFYKTIYINMYGGSTSTKVPLGFTIDNNATQQEGIVHKSEATGNEVDFSGKAKTHNADWTDNRERHCIGKKDAHSCAKRWAITFGVLLVIVVLMGVGVLFYFTSQISMLQNENLKICSERDSLKKEIELLNTNLQNKDAETAKITSDYERQIARIQLANKNLSAEIESLNNSNLGQVFNFNPGEQYSDFYASKDVLVVGVGEQRRIDITFKHYDSSVEWTWTNNGTTSNSYGDWESQTFPVYITGERVGTCVYTFSNEHNSEIFEILIIVLPYE